jgi:propanediol utilization protein
MTASPGSSPFTVVIAARHVRLSSAHLEVLFGAGTALVDVCDIEPTGTFASDRVVDVRGPAGTLKHVRVVGPAVRATEVRIGARDAAVLGVDEQSVPGLLAHASSPLSVPGLVAHASSPLSVPVLDASSTSSPGCTLEGPKGTVVLAAGVRVGLRQLALTADVAREHGLKDGDRAAIVVRGEREREMRDVPVQVAKACWAEIDVDDANALDVGAQSVAVISSRA